MLTKYAATLTVDHDPELTREQIEDAIPEALGSAGILFVRKPTTTDADVANQTIDPVSLCFVARLAGVWVEGVVTDASG